MIQTSKPEPTWREGEGEDGPHDPGHPPCLCLSLPPQPGPCHHPIRIAPRRTPDRRIHQRAFLHLAVPVAVARHPARRAHGLARVADLRRHRTRIPGDADVPDLRLESGPGSGRHLDAWQSRAPVLGHTGADFTARAAAVLPTGWACGRGGRRGDRLVDSFSGTPSVAELRTAVATRRRAGARRGATDREAWTSSMAEPALGLPDRLYQLLLRRLDRATRAQGKRDRCRAVAGSTLVWHYWHLQRLERAVAICRGAPWADHPGRSIGRDLSADHCLAHRDHAAECADHRTNRRRYRADGRWRGAGLDRLSPS